jgi:hypothetical protein
MDRRRIHLQRLEGMSRNGGVSSPFAGVPSMHMRHEEGIIPFSVPSQHFMRPEEQGAKTDPQPKSDPQPQLKPKK